MTPAPTSALRVPSDRVAVRRHALAARVVLGAFGAFAAGMGLAVAGAPGAVALASVAALVAMLGVARRLASGGSPSPGVLELSPDAVVVERQGAPRHAVPGRDIAAGWVVPDAEGAQVEIQRANGDVITARVGSTEEGHAALAAAGLDARRRAVRVLLGGRWDGLGYGLATVLFVVLQGTPMFLLLAVMLALTATATLALAAGLLTLACVAGARLLGPAQVTVGADGVSWKRGFNRGFIAYRDLASVEVWHGNDIMLRRRAGEAVLLSHSRRDPARAAGVVELIRAAMARSHGDASPGLEMLDRNGRTLDAWREALRALVGATAYRAVSLSRDDLARALDDPEAAPERRLGAALALAEAGDPDARTRIRVAADACASDELRAALREVAADALDDASVARVARHGDG